MKPLTIRPLTSTAFFQYGDVIEMDRITAQPMNRGMAERYHALASIETYGDKARAVISLVNSRCYEMPHVIDLVERHPLGSQAFIPLDDTPFIVIVAPSGEQVSTDSLQAFQTNGRQGINYRAGVWHGPLFTPFGDMPFVCVDREGDGNNCQEWHFDDGDQRSIEF